MLQLYDAKHNKKCILREFIDARVEKDLKASDEKLFFSYPVNNHFYKFLQEENYIRTKTQEFVVKEIHELDDWTEFVCVMNVEALEGKAWGRFESVEQTITSALNLCLVDTHWRVGNCNITKKRTVRASNCSSWEIIQDIKKRYMVDFTFDCINKKINIYEHLGTDKGVYFMDSLNVKKLETQRDSYTFYTRIIPIGKDNLSIKDINGGKNYIENYQYSNKIKTLIWKDERYTVVENLKADAEAKLNELSKPRRAYKVDIVNLAKYSNKYSILDYDLGDTITLISKDKNVREKQRIVKTTEYLLDHSVDSVEIANTILSFEDIQQDLQNMADTVSNVTCDNGRVDGKCVEGLGINNIDNFSNEVKAEVIKATRGEFEYLKANKADIQDLHAVKATIGTLLATEADITHLKSDFAEIETLVAKKATISDLESNTARIKVLESNSIATDNLFTKYSTIENLNNFKANILELVNQKSTIGQAKILEADITNLKATKVDVKELNAIKVNVSDLEADTGKFKSVFSDVLASGKITANTGIIAQGAIGDAQISSVSANKVTSGTIDTSKIQILGGKGRLRIVGDKIQVLDNKDNKLYERIMLGVDNNNNSALILRGADGKTILLDQDGLSKEGFTDGYNKVQDNSLDASKFDFKTVVTNINNGTETIKGTKVEIKNGTLDVELSKQKNKIDCNSKDLSTQSAKIQALEDGIKLKVDSQTFNKTTNEINNNLSTISTENKNYVNSKITEVKIDFSKSMTEIQAVKDLIKTSISDIDIESVQQLGKSTQEKINSLQTEFTQTNNEFRQSINSLNSNIVTTKSDLQENIKETTANINTINKKIDSNNVEIANVTNKTATLENNLDKVKAELTTSITNVNTKADTKIKDTETKVANLQLDYEGLSSKVTDVESKSVKDINSIKETTNSNSVDIKALKNEVSFKINSDEVIKEIDTVTKDYDTKINSNNSSIKALQDSIKLKVDSSTLVETQKTIDSKIDTTKQEIIDVAYKDATDKANTAVANANNYTNTKVTIIDSKLDKNNTELNVLKDKIQSVVETTNTEEIKKLVDNKVTDINQKIQTNSSKIEQTNNSITEKIESINNNITKNFATRRQLDYVDNQITEVSRSVKGIDASVRNVTNVVDKNNNTVKTLEDKVASFSMNVDGIKTEVSNTKNTMNNELDKMKKSVDNQSGATKWISSQVQQLSDKISSVVQDTDYNSKIEQLSNQISSKVNKGDVVSEINQLPDYIKIDAKHLALNGFVTFTNLYNSVKNVTSTTSISGDQIKSGTIEGITIKGSEFEGGNIDTQNLHAHGEVYLYHDTDIAGDLTINKNNDDTGGGLWVKGAARFEAGAIFKAIHKHPTWDSVQFVDSVVFNNYVETEDCVKIKKYLKVVDFASVGQLVAQTPDDETSHLLYGNTSFSENVIIKGDLWVNRAKHRTVETDHYGKVGMNAIESANCLFIDDGRAKTIAKKCKVPISNTFLETIESDYDVMITSYGKSIISVVDRQSKYFDVEVLLGEDTEFYYQIIARQKGYAKDRLQEFKEVSNNETTK